MQEPLHQERRFIQEGIDMLLFIRVTVVVLGICAVCQQEYKADEAARQYQLVREYIS